MQIVQRLLHLLFPPKCILCGQLLTPQELDLCRSCRLDAPVYGNRKNPPQFLDSFAAVWYYEGNVRKSLLRYKFHNARSFAPAYGRMLAMTVLQSHPEGFDLLTWVPVSRRRNWQRGYDQVELIARAAAKELGMVPTPLLKKVRHNQPQSSLSDAAQRRANVLGAYQILPGQDLTGKRILLLDDILTTGATAAEAARVLRTAGAGQVHCAAVAAARK